jgi:protein SCO1
MKTRQASRRIVTNGLLLSTLLAVASIGGCGKPSESPATSAPAATAEPSGHTYKMTGVVISIDKSSREVTVDSEAIPGFMDAMTMPYTVKNASELNKVKPKDKIMADLVAEPAGAYIENLSVVQSAPGKP